MIYKCNSCEKIFKLQKLTISLLIKKENLLIFCPYCNNTDTYKI